MKTKSAPSVAAVMARDPKGRKFISIVEAAYNSAGLSEEEAQRVNETPGLSELVVSFIGDNRASNKFKTEEVSSTYSYPAGYQPKGVAEQIKILHGLFTDVQWGYFRSDESAIAIPEGAEGLFAIPRWEKVGKTYTEAVEKVLSLLKQTRTDGFYNYREGALGPDRLRPHARTAHALDLIAEGQEGHDILVIPAQFGLRHRGRSVRRAREVFTSHEFGLGAFQIGCMLLTHPEREVQWEQLHIDCAGDEYKPGEARDFSRAPYFYWSRGKLGFYTDWYDAPGDHFGSVSGFVPQ